MILAEHIGTKSVYGMEIVKSRIAKAIKNGIKVKTGDLNKMFPYENEEFDVVHSNQVIEHLYDTDNFVAEIYRILKKGGYALVSTENLSSWHNIFALILGFQPFSSNNISLKGNIGNPFSLHNEPSTDKTDFTVLSAWLHMRLFSYFALKDLFQRYGFKTEKIVTAGYYPLPGSMTKLDPIHGHWITIKARK